MEIIRTY